MKFLARLTQWPWRLIAFAMICAVLAAWSAERMAVSRALVKHQEKTTRLAAHVSDVRKRALAMGAMTALGRASAVVQATAQGSLPPANEEAKAALLPLVHEFSFSNILILDKNGVIVAYESNPDTAPDVTGLGKNLAFRPYFKTAIRGQPSTYAAVGSNSGQRGIYIAAPIVGKEAAAPVGVVVAKIGFEQVDALLAREEDPFAIVSPEGVIFASNVSSWVFHVVGAERDLAALAKDPRTPNVFGKHAPEIIKVSATGWLDDGTHRGRMVSASVGWDDLKGEWRLIGLADPSRAFGFAERLLVGAVSSFLIIFFVGWLQANKELALRAKELEAANLELAALTKTDALTGLANRRRFDEVIVKEWARARRAGTSLSLLMIDVDHFKKYNDRYGHSAGDECLRVVGSVLATCVLRASGLACRYGGEEFALILPGLTGPEAATLAEKARNATASLAIPHEASPLGIVTLSIGVAEITAADAGDDPDPLVESADNALYQAKRAGRNRVTLAQTDAESA